MKPAIRTSLLVLVVGVAGVLAGRSMQPSTTVGRVATQAPQSPRKLAALEAGNSTRIGSAPRRTFLGPDGKTRLIDYGVDGKRGQPAAPSREALLQAILSDLRHHPRLTGSNYGLTDAQIAAFIEAPARVPPNVLETLPRQ